MKLCETARSYGTETLSLAEIVSLAAQPWASTDEIGKKVLSSIQPRELPNAGIGDFVAKAGLTEPQAAALRCALDLASKLHSFIEPKTEVTTPDDVADVLMAELRYKDREHLVVLCLDTKNRILKRSVVSIGTLTSALAHPREIFKPAIACSAASIILAHNHPSGDPSPSREDIELTKQIQRASELLGIEFLDHIVIGDGTWVSLKERGAM